ncbi:unnamed protein product [Amoebophrya sp. A25]|nr:unnamed protein product [Amoebophrya sp. A25]|eukprot:GSA25T00005447001.1
MSSGGAAAKGPQSGGSSSSTDPRVISGESNSRTDKSVGLLTDNLRRKITEHMVEDTEETSKHMVTMLASRINQVGCQILSAFPPHMREMPVKKVWCTLDAKTRAENSAAGGKSGPEASLPPGRKPGELQMPPLDDAKSMTDEQRRELLSRLCGYMQELETIEHRSKRRKEERSGPAVS